MTYTRALALNRAREYHKVLMRYPNVVGVAVGKAKVRGKTTNTEAIIVMVTKKLPLVALRPQHTLPRDIDGVRVDVQETGILEAHK